MEIEGKKYHHSFSIQVRFTDIDMMGHVTNSVHLAYCDDARMNYFNEVLDERIECSEESLVIASVNVDFMKPVLLYEELEIRTKTFLIGNKSIQMYQYIVNTDTMEVKSKLRTVVSGFDYINQKAIVIPQRWKDKIAAYEQDVEFKVK